MRLRTARVGAVADDGSVTWIPAAVARRWAADVAAALRLPRRPTPLAPQPLVALWRVLPAALHATACGYATEKLLSLD